MENFNNIPSSGTYGAAIALINANFQLTKEQLERLEHSREGFCGMYDTSTDLQAAYPNPTTGSFAYVGTDFPMAVYLVSNGSWYESTQEYDGGSIDLTQYASASSVTALTSRVATLEGAGYLLAGVANPSVAPDSSNHDKRYLFAWTPGTYSSYGQFTIADGEFGILIYNGSSWSFSKTDLIAKSIAGGYDSVPTDGSTKPITSGAVYDALDDMGATIPDVDNLNFAETILYPDERVNFSLRYAQEAITGFTLLSATASKAGLLSAADKTKLDNILTNIRSMVFADTTALADEGSKLTETLKWTVGGAQEIITSLTILAATTSKAGLLSAADKAKLDALWSSGYQFAGIATPSTTPISTTSKIFYIATEAGTYFNAVTVTQGINIIYKSGDTWSVAQVVGIDNEPTAGSNNLVKSGGVVDELFKITGVKSHTQTIIKKNADWTYHIFAFNGLQGQKAKVTLKDPNGALTGATFYYGASTTGSYFALNSGESKVITFPTDFTELTMYVGNAWVITQNPADVEIIFEYDTGTEYKLEDLDKTKHLVETKLNELAEALTKNIDITNDLIIGALSGYVYTDGTIKEDANWIYKTLLLKKGQTITVDAATGNYPKLGIAQSGTVEVGDVVTVVSGDTYTASSDTWVVVSEGSRLISATLSDANNIFDMADNNPDFNSSNVVSSKGIANALKNVRADGRIEQESSLFLYKDGLNRILNTNLSAKKGDIIIVTLIDNDNVLSPGSTIPIYHGDPNNGVPYTNITVGVPTEITLTQDVDNFYIYVSASAMTKTGYITLKLDYKGIYDELADDVDALKTKCEMPFDNIVALKRAVSSAYDSGITLQAGQEIEVTLIDNEGIITANSLPLYRNSTSGSYVNLVPDVPTKIQASEQTHFLLYVHPSWISASGNVTLHVEYINTSDIIDITLPSKAYAYVGGEFNIYNENVAYITQKDRYYVYWGINDINAYKVYSDRLELIPTAQMVGNHIITCYVKDKYNDTIVLQRQMTFEVVSNLTVENKKVLFIGDSLTNAGYYPHFIEYLSNNGIQSIGTRESEVWSSFVEGRRDIVHHEGRGGWSARDYVRNYPDYRTDAQNPFWNPSTEKFDFSYYMTEQGYSKPDAVFINLGTNDVGFLGSQVSAINEMITSIHAYDSSIPIFIHLITPPATQDGWAYTGNGGVGYGNSYAFDKSARDERKRYIEEFDNQISNVFITPAYFNIDRYHDFPTVEEQLSQRNTETVVRQAETVHLKRVGYYKMGDVYYANLMKVLS